TLAGSVNFETSSSHTIDVRATSADGSISDATFTIAVVDINDAPVAVADSASTIVNNAVILDPLANDSDEDGDALTVVIVTGPSNGTLSVDGSGNLVYTPDTSFFGLDTITYRANDGTADSATVTIGVSVAAGGSGGGGDGSGDDGGSDDGGSGDDGGDDSTTEDESTDDDSTDETEDENDDEDNESNPLVAPINKVDEEIEQELRTANVLPSIDATVQSQEQDQETSRQLSEYFGLTKIVRYTADETDFGNAASLERLLQLDLQQAVVWTSWDEYKNESQDTSFSFFVGSAATTAGVFSVGYLLYVLRGGAFLAAMSSSVPTWRMIDPAALLSAYRANTSSADDAIEQILR
ncbi:MAG: Ig-like domain-containing protein, partial [Pirellulaceae bacterium]|nr:Ig-like domain-containing protein [Pirellulaceae bacterium]